MFNDIGSILSDCNIKDLVREAGCFRLQDSGLSCELEQKSLEEFKDKYGKEYRRVTAIFKEYGVPEEVEQDFLCFCGILYENLYYQGIKDGVKIAFEFLSK